MKKSVKPLASHTSASFSAVDAKIEQIIKRGMLIKIISGSEDEKVIIECKDYLDHFFSKLETLEFKEKFIKKAINSLVNIDNSDYKKYLDPEKVKSDLDLFPKEHDEEILFRLSLVMGIKGMGFRAHLDAIKTVGVARLIQHIQGYQAQLETFFPKTKVSEEVPLTSAFPAEPEMQVAEEGVSEIQPSKTYSEAKLDATRKLQNWFRTIESYTRMSNGSLYEGIKYLKYKDESQSQREVAFQKRLEGLFSGLPSGIDKEGAVAALGLPERLSYEDFRSFKTLSTKNLKALRSLVSGDRAELGDIQLSDFMQKFCEARFCLVHFTKSKFLQNHSLLSLRTLLSKDFSKVHQSWNEQGKFGMEIAGTPLSDMEILGDTGFVFFHFQPPHSAHKVHSNFGTEFYSIPVTAKEFQEKNILFTLADAGAGGMAFFRESKLFNNIFVSPRLKYANQEVEDSVFYFFNNAIEQAFHEIGSILDKTQLFVRNDVLSGIALCIVHLYAVLQQKYKKECEKYIRNPGHDGTREKFFMYQSKVEIIKNVLVDLETFLKSDLKEDEKLNALINGWIRPFAKVPGGITLPPETLDGL